MLQYIKHVRYLLLALVVYLLPVNSASAQVATYVNVINSNYGWYCPVPNALAYASSTSSFNNSIPIGDQTLWNNLSAAANGTFTGNTIAQYNILGSISTSYANLNGVVRSNGDVSILFTATDSSGNPTGGTPTLGVGKFQAYGSGYQMEMQMIAASGIYVQHWAYMLPYASGFTPPQPVVNPVSNLSAQWAWSSGTVWRIVSPTLFGTTAPGRFAITKFNGGYFLGEGVGPAGGKTQSFTQLGSITPEGAVLFNSISQASSTLNSFYGTISGDSTSSTMTLGAYNDPTSTANLALITPYAQKIANNDAGKGAAVALYSIASSSYGLTNQWLSDFNTLEGLGGSAFSTAISQTLPVFSGASVWNTMSVLSNINQIVETRQLYNHGIYSGDTFQGDETVWMKPFGSWVNQSNQNGAYGFRSDSGGVVFGGDKRVNENSYFGAGVAWANSSAQSNASNAAQTLNSNLYQLLAYGSLAASERIHVNLSANGGWGSNSSNRSLSSFDAMAQANYKTAIWHVGGSISNDLFANEVTHIIPSLRLDYSYLKNQSYSESSNSNNLGLNVSSQSYEMLVLGADGRLVHKLSDHDSINANVGIGYNFSPTQTSVNAAFEGAPNVQFITYGVNPSPVMGRVGAGYTHKVHQNVDLGVRYDVSFQSGYTNQIASVTGKWLF